MDGGTACVTVRQVAQAIVGAAERGEAGARYPVGGVNISWKELYGKLHALLGGAERYRRTPKWLLKALVRFVDLSNTLRGLEAGLDHSRFMDLQCSETYIDPAIAAGALGVLADDFDMALRETVAACYPGGL
jgi:hypothetical protein